MSGEILTTPGICIAFAPIISDIVTTGRSEYLDEMRGKYPPGIFEFLRVPKLGLNLRLLGWHTGIGSLTTLGIILLVIGAVLWILGAVGRPVGGRRYWW